VISSCDGRLARRTLRPALNAKNAATTHGDDALSLGLHVELHSPFASQRRASEHVSGSAMPSIDDARTGVQIPGDSGALHASHGPQVARAQ
jgi:hypothetical protein